MTLVYATDRSDAADIRAHLQACDAEFHPALSSRVDLSDYARKLATHAARFEAWSGGTLVGLVAVYANAPDRGVAFVSNVSVLPGHIGQGIGQSLMQAAVGQVRARGFARLALEVDAQADAALRLYRRLGFVMLTQGQLCRLELVL